ncbi:MAG: hypothetical protein ABI574_16870 [Burkholderiales bacterium]
MPSRLRSRTFPPADPARRRARYGQGAKAAALLLALLTAPPLRAQEPTGPPTGVSTLPSASPPTDEPEPRREMLRDFFDSLSDVALTLNRLQVYQRNGQRREVDLRDDTLLWLDETRPSLLSNPRGTPFSASRAGRALGLTTDREHWRLGALYERRDDIHRVGVDAAWRISERWQLVGSSSDVRSTLAEVPGDPVTGLRRQDREVGLQWQGGVAGGLRLRSTLTVRDSELQPSLATAQAPAGRADFLFWRNQIELPRWPGLSVGATLAQPLRSQDGLAPELRTGRAELGAEWRLGPGHPLSGLPEGSRLAWREAPRLGLLSDDEALTRMAAYKRSIALEVPDGSPGGAVYAQLRQHSLASAEDAQALFGWRHGWRPSGKWGLESRVEQALPLQGPNPIRATQVGGRTWYSDFPRRSVTADATAVTGTKADSVYAGAQLTERLADDWLSAWQLSGSRAQPHGEPEAGVGELKASAALGWREPSQRALHLLGRLAWSARDVSPAYADPLTGHRHAWIWLGHAGLLVDDENTATLRLSRRLEHDALINSPDPRTSRIALARWTRTLAGTRWSLSGHVADRRDSRDGHAWGFGAEIGWRLSSRLDLALGINPRGFSDNELTLDERPSRGVVLRLRFNVEKVLDRWLDAGRSDGANRPSAGWGDATPWEAALRPAAQALSPTGMF